MVEIIEIPELLKVADVSPLCKKLYCNLVNRPLE